MIVIVIKHAVMAVTIIQHAIIFGDNKIARLDMTVKAT
jgi:hypothetical protein